MTTNTVELKKRGSAKWHLSECRHAPTKSSKTVVADTEDITVRKDALGSHRITIYNVAYRGPFCYHCANMMDDGHTSPNAGPPDPITKKKSIIKEKLSTKPEPVILEKEDKLEPSAIKQEDDEELECASIEQRPVILYREAQDYGYIRVSTQPTGYQLTPEALKMIKKAALDMEWEASKNHKQSGRIDTTVEAGNIISTNSAKRQAITITTMLAPFAKKLVSEIADIISTNEVLCLYEEFDGQPNTEDKIPSGERKPLIDGNGLERKPVVENKKPDLERISEYIKSNNEIRLARHIQHKTEIIKTDTSEKSIRARNTLTGHESTVWFSHGKPVNDECDCDNEMTTPCEHVTAVLRNLPRISGVFAGKGE